MIFTAFHGAMYPGLIIILFGLLLLLGYKKKGILDKRTVISPFGILLIDRGNNSIHFVVCEPESTLRPWRRFENT